MSKWIYGACFALLLAICVRNQITMRRAAPALDEAAQILTTQNATIKEQNEPIETQDALLRDCAKTMEEQRVIIEELRAINAHLSERR